jgi:hypothetical protein
MKVHTVLEISNWSRRIAIGIRIGLGLAPSS